MKRKDLLRDLRNMNIVELKTRIDELKSHLLNMKIKLKEGQLKNSLSIRMLRHNIARANTILREKEKIGAN